MSSSKHSYDRQRILESWETRINPVSSRKSMSEDEKFNFGRVLENTKRLMGESGYTAKCEANSRNQITQSSDIGFKPPHIINMVSLLYLYQVADELVSVQPLDHEYGVFYYLQYLYGDNRGDALRGNEMINRYGGFKNGDIRTRYASQNIDGETSADAGKDAVIQLYLQHLPILMDAEHPIDFVSNTNSADVWRLRKTGEGTKDYQLRKVGVTGYEEGSNLLAVGQPLDIDLDSGVIRITTSSALCPAGVNLRYSQDLSVGPTDAGTVTLKLTADQIKAEPHKLRSNYVFDAGYALMKSHGIDVEESLIAACAAEIRKERDDLIIKTLLKQAGAKSTWSTKVDAYISQEEHNRGFVTELFAATTEINYRTKRAAGNWAVVGKRGLDVLNSTGRLVKEPVGDKSGPYIVGRIDDDLKVIYSPFIDPNEYLVGYKGNEFTDAGFVVADYLPIASTDFVMLDDFVGRKGYVSYYGTKMLNPNMYVSGRIVNT